MAKVTTSVIPGTSRFNIVQTTKFRDKLLLNRNVCDTAHHVERMRTVLKLMHAHSYVNERYEHGYVNTSPTNLYGLCERSPRPRVSLFSNRM
jgi:hypothetical protein